MGVFDKTVLLMLPPQEEEVAHASFLSVKDQTTVFSTWKKKQKPGRDHRCVGSSHGWLVLLNEEADPYLWNPFTWSHTTSFIKLPTKDTFPHLLGVTKTPSNGWLVSVNRESSGFFGSLTLKDMQKSVVTKAILSGNPNSTDKYSVIGIYGFESKIVVFTVGGERRWVDIGAKPSVDIVASPLSNRLLSLCQDGSIQVWDLNDILHGKIMEIQPSFERSDVFDEPTLAGLYSSNSYLVEANRDMLLVNRLVGEFVSENDKLVYEGDLLDGDTNQPLVFPYRTVKFKVFKLDFARKEWVETGSVGNGAIFVGGNESIWLPKAAKEVNQEWESNSVYFTDDYWERIDEDYLYGGHDMGVYRMEDKSVKRFYLRGDDVDSERLDPPPIWVVSPYNAAAL